MLILFTIIEYPRVEGDFLPSFSTFRQSPVRIQKNIIHTEPTLPLPVLSPNSITPPAVPSSSSSTNSSSTGGSPFPFFLRIRYKCIRGLLNRKTTP